jgi:hypothetical protein
MKHSFVDFIPKELEANVLYIALDFDIAAHLCCCGCGNEVVTPLAPAQWSFTYDGASISLSPSIGNWSFPCQSHYWIRKGKVDWASKFSEEKIRFVRDRDRSELMSGHSQQSKVAQQSLEAEEATHDVPPRRRGGILGRLLALLK